MNINSSKFLKSLPSKLYNPNSILKSVFNGEIIIFEKSIFINKIIKTTKSHFKKIFTLNLEDFLNNKDDFTFDKKEKLFLKLQKNIKECSVINENFISFLEELGFKTEYVFKDQYSLRYSPNIYGKSFGKLKPAPPHRDTWASNLFNQINFWFPIHKISSTNSIYIVPKYFKEKVENNSMEWSFESFKKKDDYPSAPYAKINIQDEEKQYFQIDKGNIICFSGHHLHGSLQNQKDRINLETRIIYTSQSKDMIEPKNKDSESKIIKKNWFRNILTNKVLD